MLTPGRLVVKIAGRDAGRVGIILAVREDGMLLVDGAVRRRYVNPIHLEPLEQTVDGVSEATPHEDVVKHLQEAGFNVKPRKQREEKQTGKKTRKQDRKATQEKKEEKNE